MTRDEMIAFGVQMRNLERAAHTAEHSRRPDRADIAESCRWAASRLTHYRDQEAAALRAPAVTGEAERAWLIECHRESVLHYWTGRVIGGVDKGQWSHNIDLARRFARREDAECMLTWHLAGNGRVAEHLWPAPVASPPAVTGEAAAQQPKPHTCTLHAGAECYHEMCQPAAPPAAGAPPADEAIAREIMTTLVPLVSDAAIVGRTYGWAEVLDIVRAVAVKFAGAPPALVALDKLHEEYRHARDAYRNGNQSYGDDMNALHDYYHEKREALLAWSPAPAPVAPPSVEHTCGAIHFSAVWGDVCPACEAAEALPAPPAVAGGDAPPGWPDANNAVRWKPGDIVGHATVRDADGSLRHEPLTREVANALWKKAEEARLRRAASMPDERAAIAVLFSAWLRLKELGWKEAEYCPKDGTPFDAIEPGSTGVHHCVYEGQWPDGRWWTSDEHDMYPSRPILWRRRQEGQ